MPDQAQFSNKEVYLFCTVVDREDNSSELNDGIGSANVNWDGAIPAVGTQRVFAKGVIEARTVNIAGVIRIERIRLIAVSVDTWLI